MDMESASGVDDRYPGPLFREFVVQCDRLTTDLFELPIAERKASMTSHLRLDVTVNRTVHVLRIEVERELLPEEQGASPGARVIERRLAGRIQGAVHIPIVVHAFREVLQEVGTEILRIPGVVHDQGDVLQVSETPRVDSGMPSEDQGVDPLALGMGHPLRGSTEVHRPQVTPPTITEPSA